MRLASFLVADRPSYGPRVVDGYLDMRAAWPDGPADLKAFIAAGTVARERARNLSGPVVPAAEVTLLPVIPNPGKFVCLGLNFRDHAAEGGFAIPDYPALFLRATSSLIAANAPLVRPRASDTFDYEAELAVVIGTRARHLTQAQALDAVFGYAPFNDGSVRTYQRKTHQWTAGKNFDGTGAFGPEIVTADETPPGAHGLAVRCRLNGAVLQDGDTADMIFPVAQAVSILSEIMTLEPGDVIAMGTPAGVGHARTPPLWMKPGDVCEIEIEGIGVLRNPVVDEAA